MSVCVCVSCLFASWGSGLELDVTHYGVSHHSEHTAASSYWHIHAETGRLFFWQDVREDLSESVWSSVRQVLGFFCGDSFADLNFKLPATVWVWIRVFFLFFFAPYLWGKCLLSVGIWVFDHQSGLKLPGKIDFTGFSQPVSFPCNLPHLIFSLLFVFFFSFTIIVAVFCFVFCPGSGHSVFKRMNQGLHMTNNWASLK